MKTASIAVDQPGVTEAVVAPQQVGTVITVEMLLYAAIFGVAAALRFLNLAAAPLSAREAAQALAAMNGSAMPAGGSPLLYGLNQFLFGIFGATVNDTGVRLGAALIGTIMVLLPALLRLQIGRYGALGASLMLAISPTLVVAARSLDGQIVVATCALAALAFGVRYFTAQRSIDLIGLAIAIGLALTGGPGVMTALFVIAPGLLVAYLWIATDDDRAKLKQLRQDAHALRTALIAGGVAFFLAATVLLLDPAGLANIPESLSAWIAAWRETDTVSALRVFQIMLLYEPLIVGVGLIGMVFALRRINGLTVLLGIWMLGALIAALLQPGRQVLDLTLVLTPLALLGGTIVEAVANALAQHGSWRAEGVFWIVFVVLLTFAAVRASLYAAGLISASSFLGIDLSSMTSTAISSLAMFAIAFIVFLLVIGWRATVRAGLVTLLVSFAVISFSSAWAVTQLHPSDPHELLWGPSATSNDVWAMVEAIQDASKRQTGFVDRGTVAVTLPQDNPVVRWYLRGFPNMKINGAVEELAPVVVAPLGSSFPPNVADPYRGKQFVIRAMWEPSVLASTDLMKWWLYRESPQPPLPEQTMVVWEKLK